MTNNVSRYQIYCETEATWKYVWGQEPPTVCPTNTAHTVNPNSVAIVENISSTEVTVKQPTEGYFIVEGIPLVFPSCTPGTVQMVEHSFDETILLWKTIFNITDSMIGDTFSIIINPDMPIGGLTATANAGDTILHVNSTVYENVVTGMYVKLDADDSPPYTNAGKIINVDKTAGTITLKKALTESFPPGTIVYLNIYMAKDIVLDAAFPSEYGEKGFSAKQIPKGTIIRMFYTNNDGNAKTMNWRIGYYYGLGLD